MIKKFVVNRHEILDTAIFATLIASFGISIAGLLLGLIFLTVEMLKNV